MNENFYKSYEELPLMLSVQEIAKVLGISKTSWSGQKAFLF